MITFSSFQDGSLKTPMTRVDLSEKHLVRNKKSTMCSSSSFHHSCDILSRINKKKITYNYETRNCFFFLFSEELKIGG